MRALHHRLQQYERFDTPSFHDLGRVLDDREAMLAVARQALADRACGGDIISVWAGEADALGDADLTVIALRRHPRGFLWPGSVD